MKCPKCKKGELQVDEEYLQSTYGHVNVPNKDKVFFCESCDETFQGREIYKPRKRKK